jgi:hypothetical protein
MPPATSIRFAVRSAARTSSAYEATLSMRLSGKEFNRCAHSAGVICRADCASFVRVAAPYFAGSAGVRHRRCRETLAVGRSSRVCKEAGSR